MTRASCLGLLALPGRPADSGCFPWNGKKRPTCDQPVALLVASSEQREHCRLAVAWREGEDSLTEERRLGAFSRNPRLDVRIHKKILSRSHAANREP